MNRLHIPQAVHWPARTSMSASSSASHFVDKHWKSLALAGALSAAAAAAAYFYLPAARAKKHHRPATRVLSADEVAVYDFLDAHDDSPYSATVLLNMRRVWSELAPSGTLDVAQFSALMHRVGLTDALVIASYFKHWDTKRDMELSFEEVACAMGVLEHGTQQQQIDAIFAVYDLDGNKKLTGEELTRALRSMAGLRRAQLGLPHALTAQDATEIDAQVTEIFDQTDKDGNGVITLKELSQFSAADISFDSAMVRAFSNLFGTSIKLKKAHSLVNL